MTSSVPTALPSDIYPDPRGTRAADLGAVTHDRYRTAFRRHPGGVAVITLDHHGTPRGVTVSSLHSLSLDPALVAFSIATTSSTWPSLAAVDRHVVNLLGLEQVADARRFATSGVDRFAAPTRWTRTDDGSPVLESAAGWLHCTVEQRISTGDHWLVISRIDEIHHGTDGEPLVYHDGDFHTIAPLLRAR